MNTIILDDGISYQVIRCGIIPYYQIDNDNFMLLMPYKRYYENYDEGTFRNVKHLLNQNGGAFSDFGGGIRKNENYIQGLIREVEEESNNIFDDVSSLINKSLKDSRTQMIIYKTKSPHNKIYLEYLIDIKEDKDYINKFKDNGINDEHEYIKWQSIKRDEKGNLHFLDLDKNIVDKAIYPIFFSIVNKLEHIKKKVIIIDHSKLFDSSEQIVKNEKSYRQIVSNIKSKNLISDDNIISHHKIIDHDNISNIKFKNLISSDKIISPDKISNIKTNNLSPNFLYKSQIIYSRIPYCVQPEPMDEF